MPYCQVEDGVRLYYEAHGQGDPVVFIHGGGVSHEGWEQQVCAVGAHHRAIAYDLRGHGESDKPAHGHNFSQFTTDLEALVKDLGLERMALVAHAVGGYIAMEYALRHPDAVARMVLVSTGARFIGEDEERGGFSWEFFREYMEGLDESKVEATAKVVDTMFFYRDPGEATRRHILNIMLQWPLFALKQMSNDARTIDFRDRLGQIDAPVLVIHGRHDRKQRYSGAQHLCDSIPDSRLVTFEESAHLPFLEEVARFNEVLLEFLGQ